MIFPVWKKERLKWFQLFGLDTEAIAAVAEYINWLTDIDLEQWEHFFNISSKSAVGQAGI